MLFKEYKIIRRLRREIKLHKYKINPMCKLSVETLKEPFLEMKIQM